MGMDTEVGGGQSRRVLTVQDDGMLARPGLDDDAEVLAQAFVGAPWTRADEPYRRMMEEAGVPEAFVGNGGLSLRDPSMMLEVAEAAERDGLARALFNGNLQPLPEDVMFAVGLARRGMVTPRAVAQRFAFEELPPAAEMPYGFHKPWPYMAASAAADAFDRLLYNRRN